MKKILVPVDFADNSKNALDYAQELSLYLGASIEVIHVMHPSMNPSHPNQNYNFEEEIELRTDKLDEFVEAHLEEKGSSVLTKIKKEIIIGLAGEEIVNHAKNENTDLIVMGTTGVGGVIDRILGSISSIVSQNARCPILLIPKKTIFKDFDNIMYASDFSSSSNKMLESIVDLSARFQASIHLTHVQPEQEQHDFELEELIINQIAASKKPNTDIKYVTIWDTNIFHGLNIYARDHSIDLIVLVRPKRNFWERMIHRSVTRQMILATPRPILILPV